MTLLSNKFPLLIFLFLLPYAMYGQLVEIDGIPRDTSFNLISEFKKQQINYPDISLAKKGDTSALTIHHDITYLQLENRSLKLDIIYLSHLEKSKLPTVLLIHGGGWRSGDKSMEYPMAMELARRGYVSICIEYRLSPEAVYPVAVEDVITAVRWVRSNACSYPIDRQKIVLYGTSAGGQLASLVGTINGVDSVFNPPYHTEIDAVVNTLVNVDGLSAFIHPESGEGQDRPGRPSAATWWFNSTTDERPDLRYEASPITHVHSNSVPILFINSSIPRFSAGRDDMIEKLTEHGIYSQNFVHKNAMHTFWLFHPWFDKTVELTDDFLKKVLNP
ncbi:alpha/beta hydrolase [Alkalitalea saponilacus]|uniref:Acetyl esterase/lipase n=1 Tax=Alkalitalea saponilacus TaxID=889453 RepID=A0A1T5G9N6_9BACT|nr:alpha/beta hydrolase [Alkalitalea saponilacus]ASB47900.1 esterase [Alkalitalea saponilacus]SKC05085.1 Acetyl esterase/lipase [Alkalitalea saponilacus]